MTMMKETTIIYIYWINEDIDLENLEEYKTSNQKHNNPPKLEPPSWKNTAPLWHRIRNNIYFVVPMNTK